MADQSFDPEVADKIKAITNMPYGPARLKAWGVLLASMPSGNQRFAVKELAFWEIYGSINDGPDTASVFKDLAAEHQEEFDAAYPRLKELWADKGRFDATKRVQFRRQEDGTTEVTIHDLPPKGYGTPDEEMKILRDFDLTHPITVSIGGHDVEEPTCFRCGKPASEFYTVEAQIEGLEDAAEFCRQEEGTYSPATNHFACDGCYIAIGMPTSSKGWRAP